MNVGFSDEKKFKSRKLKAWNDKGRLDLFSDRLVYNGKKFQKTMPVTSVTSVERANPIMYAGQDFGICCIKVNGTEPLYFYSTSLTRHKEQEEIIQLRDACMTWWQQGNAQQPSTPDYAQPDPSQQPQMQPQQDLCSTCGQAVYFIQQYNSYYCYSCQKYM
jgi:hypothetical protein